MEASAYRPGSFIHQQEPAAPVESVAHTSSLILPSSLSALDTLSKSVQPISFQYSESTCSRRKRPRVNTRRDVRSTPWAGCPSDLSSTSTFGLDIPSPAPLADERYTIAGGTDTPLSQQLREEDAYHYDFEQDCRPNRYSLHTPTALDNQGTRRSLASATQTGWAGAMLALTGTVAGKLFNLCWNTAFHGFRSGPGKGYDLDMGTPKVGSSDWSKVNDREDVFQDTYQHRNTVPSTSPFPGSFPADEPLEDSVSSPPSHQNNSTPTGHDYPGGGSVLRGNWVVVNEPDSAIGPDRRKSRPSTRSIGGRSSSRSSIGVRPRLQVSRTSTSSASFASPRGTGDATGVTLKQQLSDGIIRKHKRSRSSIASPRQAEAAVSVYSSPKSPEAIRLEKRLRRNDQKQDESMKRLNQQMQDMIKEAQQALGSKVEIAGEVEDEGYDDSGW